MGSAGIQSTPTAPPVEQGHPPAFWFFFWGEFAERCSYYGMRAILLLYLTQVLRFTDTTGASIYYWFKMSCYFLPLLGGWLADRFFGRYWTIVGFSVPYVLGHFILGIPNQVALFIALALLAGGSGVIKPNISTLMGQTYDLERPGQERLRSAAFLWFYFSINVGALISTFALPFVRDEYGYALAFQFPAWLMVGALAVFAGGKPYYAPATFDNRESTPEERAERWRTLVRLFGVFGLMIFFWVAYEHNDSLWVLFARDYVDRVVPFMRIQLSPSLIVRFTEIELPPDQIQFLNPLFVLILIPFFNWFFKKIDPQTRVFRPTRKILLGFIFTAAASGLMALAGYFAQASEALVSIVWLVGGYIILTMGEVLLYGTGLELAYTAAPKSMKGFVTACFLLTNTLGNLINSGLAQLYGGSLKDPIEKRGPMSPAAFFGMTSLMVVVASVAFYFVGKQFDRRNDADAAAALPNGAMPTGDTRFTNEPEA